MTINLILIKKTATTVAVERENPSHLRKLEQFALEESIS